MKKKGGKSKMMGDKFGKIWAHSELTLIRIVHFVRTIKIIISVKSHIDQLIVGIWLYNFCQNNKCNFAYIPSSFQQMWFMITNFLIIEFFKWMTFLACLIYKINSSNSRVESNISSHYINSTLNHKLQTSLMLGKSCV